VISAPWYNGNDNITALADMAIAKNAKGMLLTTWNTLPAAIRGVATAAGATWGGAESLKHYGGLTDMAAYIRKLRGGPADFKNAGWRRCEVDDNSWL